MLHLDSLPTPLPVLGILGQAPQVKVGLEGFRPQDVVSEEIEILLSRDTKDQIKDVQRSFNLVSGLGQSVSIEAFSIEVLCLKMKRINNLQECIVFKLCEYY